MRILIITQNEPFYLADNIAYLLDKILKKHEVVGVLLQVLPFWQKRDILKKAIKTYKIFGLRIFLFYTVKFFYSKTFKKSIRGILNFFMFEIKIKGSINSK